MVTLTLEKNLDILAKMLLGRGSQVSRGDRNPFGGMFGMMDVVMTINSQYCEIALHPSFARQIAAAGYSKQAIAQWLCDKHRVSWDILTDDQKKQMKDAATSGIIPGLTLKDCKPGGTVPTLNPKHIGILVAGGMVGQTVALYSSGIKGVDFAIRRIYGATLTKAGR
jgi:hypothetical protein